MSFSTYDDDEVIGDAPVFDTGDDDEEVTGPAASIYKTAYSRGVNPDFLIGLAKLETRMGEATIKGDSDSYNLFNIKDFSGKGPRATDKAEGSRDAYRQYASYDDSANDLVDLLERKYPKALEAQTPEQFATALKQGGYATDPDYVNKIVRTINSVRREAQPSQQSTDDAGMPNHVNLRALDAKMESQQQQEPSIGDRIKSGFSAARDYVTGKPDKESVLQGMTMPDSVDDRANLAAMKSSPSPDSVMFQPGRNLQNGTPVGDIRAKIESERQTAIEPQGAPTYKEKIKDYVRSLLGAETSDSTRDEKAAAQAWILATAKRDGITVDDMRQAIGGMKPELDQFAKSAIGSASFGILEQDQLPAEGLPQIAASGLGNLAGFIAGPAKLAGMAVKGVTGGALAATAEDSFGTQLAKNVLDQAATMSVAMPLSATGKILNTNSLEKAADIAKDEALSGAKMGAVFGAAGKLIPGSSVSAFAGRAAAINGGLDVANGTNPFDDRPLEQKIFDYGLNTYFAKHGAPPVLREAGSLEANKARDAALNKWNDSPLYRAPSEQQTEVTGQDKAGIAISSIAAEGARLREMAAQRQADITKAGSVDEAIKAATDAQDFTSQSIANQILQLEHQETTKRPDPVEELPQATTQPQPTKLETAPTPEAVQPGPTFDASTLPILQQERLPNGTQADQTIQAQPQEAPAETGLKAEAAALDPQQQQAKAQSQAAQDAGIRAEVARMREIMDARRQAEQQAALEAMSNTDPAKQVTATSGNPVVEAPVKDLKLSADVPQFKSDAGSNGVVDKLEGKYDRALAAPIQVWQRTDGSMEVISGRHRLDLAQRSGEQTVPVQIHREADGFTAQHATLLDTELNVKDGRGKVKDYVRYFQSISVERSEATQRGLLQTAVGRDAYTIANAGSDELIASHNASQLTDQAATQIAQAAPKNGALQAVGMRMVMDGKSITQAVNTMAAVKLMAKERGGAETEDMFGFDDSSMRDAQAMAKIAGQEQAKVNNTLAAVRGASKRPELAAKEGVNINDQAALSNRIQALEQQKSAWSNWATNPELVAQIRSKMEPQSKQPETRTEAPAKQEQAFDLTPTTPEQIKADEERAASAAKAEAMAKQAAENKAQADAEVDDFRLTGSDRAADVAEAAGQGSLFDAPTIEAAHAHIDSSPDLNTLEKAKARAALRKGDIEPGDILPKAQEVAAAPAQKVNNVDQNQGTMFSSATATKTEPSLTTRQTVRDAIAESLPKQARAIDRMLQRGEDGKRGGMVVIESNTPEAIAKAFSEKTGRDYDAALVQVQKSADGKIQGFHDPQSGLSFVVAPNVTKGTAAPVALHEAYHGQQRDAIDTKAQALLDSADDKLHTKATREVLLEARQKIADAKETGNKGEAAAYIIEAAAQRGREAGFSAVDGKFMDWVDKHIGVRVGGIIRDFVSMVRAHSLRIGLPINLHVDDLVAYAKLGLERSAEGKTVAGDEVMQSKAKQTPPPANTPPAQQQPAAPQPTWDYKGSKADKLIYEMQDGRIDLKRVQEAIKRSGQDINEKFDARLAETLYAGRVAKRTDKFLQDDAAPLLEQMARTKVTTDELSDYLLARHAPERNAQIAKVNDQMPDGGAGTNSQGVRMTTQAANDYISNLPTETRLKMEALAQKVDAITKGTRDLLVSEGLEKQETIDAWNAAYKHYAPLFREDVDDGRPHSVGTGFSVRGDASKRATGSDKKVDNMLAHVLMQREAAITRAEKNRVAMSLYGLALSSPNKAFWTTITPTTKKAQIMSELVAMGVDPVVAEQGMEGIPTTRTVDKVTGKVVDRINPLYKSLPGAITVRVNGEDRVLMFNQKNENALRMAENLKNLDGLSKYDLASTVIGKSTRWISSVNTQYNPAFGMVNTTRDSLGALVNLSTTPLAGKQLQVFGNMGRATQGIYSALRGDTSGQWAQLYEQFQMDGGQTGYKEMFKDVDARAKAIEKQLASYDKSAISPGKAAHAVLSVLDGFNTIGENVVRLSAYKAALDNGMSRPEAAKLARELTVDFNRKGRMGRELGPLYAFFNASVQGTARTIESLKGPAGAKIISGGIALGMLQAVMLAAAGYDDDEIADWTKSRNFIIPLGKTESGEKKHILIPLPAGLNALPNIGRTIAELGRSGGKDFGKKTVSAIGEVIGALNPVDGGTVYTPEGGVDWGGVIKTVTPTILDPVVELATNKGFSGQAIEKTYRDEADNRPGFQRAREKTRRTPTGQMYIGITKTLNNLTGGNDYEAGFVSPSPEKVRYLAEAVGGGLLREIEKSVDLSMKVPGQKETKVSGIPFIGRFYGETDSDAVAEKRYYSSVDKAKSAESSINLAKTAGDGEAMQRIYKDRPEAKSIDLVNRVQSKLTKLNKLAVSQLNDSENIQKIDEARLKWMKATNKKILEMEAQGH